MIKSDIQESFNARYLSYEDIARTFIPNDQFEQLGKNNHTLLMGPRGSGKTTLLKMLTPLCQFYLKNSKSPFYKNFGFTSIYIPTDIQWNKQIEIFLHSDCYPQKLKDTFPQFLVATNILICVVNTFSQLFEIENQEDANTEIITKEIELCKLLIEDWNIEKPITPTLNSIKQSLYSRLKDGNVLLKKIKYGDWDADLPLPTYFYQDYFDLITSGCTSFESVVDHKAITSRKWALCFDELEISPEWLQLDLLEKIRSVDQRFVFKLTTSPIVSIVEKISTHETLIQAREDEDFKVIRTWNYDLKGLTQWNKFSEKLVEQKLRRIFNKETTPASLFGSDNDIRNLSITFRKPENYKSKSQSESLYEHGNYYWLLFRNLATIDPSFRKFLLYKKISPSNPLPNSPNQMDQVFRKVKEIVLFRYHFKKIDSKFRTRKNPSLYYGTPTIYEICDGNPRFLISLIDSLVAEIKDGINKININRQSFLISDYSRRYLSLIASHPNSNIEVASGKFLNLATLIEQIGHFFFERMVTEDFKMNICNTFIIDKEVSPKVLELITLGVHLGAFIYLDPKKVVSNEGLLDVKFRLSYLLHPYFNLPKREYDSIKLSNILRNKKAALSEQQLKFVM